MLKKFLRRDQPPPDNTIPESNYPIAKSGKELLALPARDAQLRKIKRLFSVTEEIWQNWPLKSNCKREKTNLGF